MLPHSWDASDAKSVAENFSNSVLQNRMPATVRLLNLLFPHNCPQLYQCQAGGTDMKLAFSDPPSSFALFSTLGGGPAPATQVIASSYSLTILYKLQCPRKMAQLI